MYTGQFNVHTYIASLQAREAPEPAGTYGGLAKAYFLPWRWTERGGGGQKRGRTVEDPQQKSTGDKD